MAAARAAIGASAPRDRAVALLHAFAQFQRPGLPLSRSAFTKHLEHMRERAAASCPTWDHFLAALFPVDAFLVAGCLENLTPAWQTLFEARVGRADRLLVDALRQRANRLFPGDEERQELAVQDFWGHLLLAPTAESVPILRRYDGIRPLVPWLIRVFQNRLISQLRSPGERAESLAEDDVLSGPVADAPAMGTGRWSEVFAAAARQWLAGIDAEAQLLLGLRWRFRLSQREIAHMMKVHEGTISRQVAALRDEALQAIGQDLERAGWTGDDLEEFILREMGHVLLDEPKLSLESLNRLLKKR